MRVRVLVGVAAAVLLLAGSQAGAQAQAKAKKKSVAVKDFEYGTIDHWWGGQMDIGRGMADQVVESLLANKTFRVIERKNLDTILAEQDFAHSDRADPSAARKSKMGKVKGVDFLITGSITKFSMEQKGGRVRLRGIGVGGGKAKAEVRLTARMVDTSTGEVIASATGAGVSSKATGLSFSKGGTAMDMGSSEFRESSLGDAQARACQQLVEELVSAYADASQDESE